MTIPHPPPLREPAAAPAAKISDVIGSYRPTKVFRPTKPGTAITSLDFDDQGEFLVAACDDETLQLYSCKEGAHAKALFSKKYGAHLARFTHQAQSILYASTKVDDTIRYLSTHDNQYIRYFPGHSGAVTSLSLSPGSDTFVSCSLDNTVRLWSLSSPNAAGKLHLHTPYLSAFDPSATVLAIASPGSSSILLYDIRHYDKAPFATFDMLGLEGLYNPPNPSGGRPRPPAPGPDARPPRPLHPADPLRRPARWASLEFSNDGRSILLGTSGGRGHYILDAFSGALAAFCAQGPAPPDPAAAAAAASSSSSSKRPSPRLPPGLLPSSDSYGGSGSSSSRTDDSPTGQGNVCFSQDGRYVVGRAGEQGLCVWDKKQASSGGDRVVNGDASTVVDAAAADAASADNNRVLRPVHDLEYKGHAAVVALNPRFNMCVSADRDVVFWLPERGAGAGQGG